MKFYTKKMHEPYLNGKSYASIRYTLGPIKWHVFEGELSTIDLCFGKAHSVCWNHHHKALCFFWKYQFRFSIPPLKRGK